LSYYMAYLKAHWPWAFWCAELSSVPLPIALAKKWPVPVDKGLRFTTTR